MFKHHRHLLQREWEARLLPVPVGEVVTPGRKIIKVWRDNRAPKVICLPDRSNVKYFEPRMPQKRKATIIIKEVCERHDISVARFLGQDRLYDVIAARQEACYRMAKETEMSVSAIGRFIRRDHTTVLNAIERYCLISNLPYPRRRQVDEAGNRRKSVQRDVLAEMAQ